MLRFAQLTVACSIVAERTNSISLVILVVCLALAERQQRRRLLNLYMNHHPGRADGGHRAPSSRGNPNRWAHKASTCTSVFTPSAAVGRERCNGGLSPTERWVSLPPPSNCCQSLAWPPQRTHLDSLSFTDFTSAVKTNKRLQSSAADCSHSRPSAGI